MAMLTNTDKAVVKVSELLQKRPRTCTEVGVALYGKGFRKSQSYARPGGRILHYMKRLGIVEQKYDGRHFFLWHLIPGWEKLVAVFKGE